MKQIIDLSLATRIINSGPLLLVGTSGESCHNMAPVAWTMPGSKKPPSLFLTVGVHHATWKNIARTGTFSCNVVSAELIPAVAYFGACSGNDVDKMATSNIPWYEGEALKAPLLLHAPAALECTAISMDAQKHLIHAEIVSACVDPRLFDGRWLVEEGFAPVHHLGGNHYQCGAQMITQPLIHEWP